MNDLQDVEYEKFWRRLQQMGLNAYEARSYLVLVGHPRFKALELAARAQVPRQKIYEVLDSLVEKGFAQVVQEKTKLFSAVEPGMAIPAYLQRQKEEQERNLNEQHSYGQNLVRDLRIAYAEGHVGRGTLEREYLEFSRPPYAVDPLDEQLVKQAAARGVACRILVEPEALDDDHRQRLDEYAAYGVEVRLISNLPMKLAAFDGTQGLIALLDPVITRPTWTAIVFDHSGMGEAMQGLFEQWWRKAEPRPSAD